MQNWDALKFHVGKLERKKTGIEGLDNIIQGGLPKNSITLVSGPPGSGKTILCLQFLYEGFKYGEKGLFLTLDKKVEGLLLQARELGLDFQPAIEQNLVKFLYLNINKKLVYETMTGEILKGAYDRIVLDSITPLSEMPIYIKNPEELNINIENMIDPEDWQDSSSLSRRRMHLIFIVNVLESSNATSIITSELPLGSHSLSRDGISEFIADGVILLNFDPVMDRRKLSVLKMRNTKHTLKAHDILIDYKGIKFV